MAASIKCLQAPMHTLSSPDCSWLSPLVLDHTRLAPTKPDWEPLRRVPRIILCIHSVLFIWHYLYLQCTFDGCEQEFTKCNQLKIHQFVHTNEKPFRSVIKFHSTVVIFWHFCSVAAHCPGSFPPTPPSFHCFNSVTCSSHCVGVHGWVARTCQLWEQSSSRSLLPIVEAP